jgi:cyclopropane-fatty-acyl-phospholipid synthase
MERLQRRFERLVEPADIRIGGDRPWDVQIHDDRLFARILATGTLGLGEAFMDGWWTCEAVDQMIHRAIRGGIGGRFGSPTDIARVIKARAINLQSGKRAWTVGEQHYDLGNDLYEAMLDPRMIYSCGYWATADDLAQAQTDKLGLIARKLQLEPGMRVLDIGCGWGGTAQYLASEYGCSVVGVTVSVEQAALARERCAGLPVEIRTQDYREVHERFDRVVSVGMFEHVGHRNYATFFDVVRRCLSEPGDLALLHTIGRRHTSARLDPWIGKYIFPNSLLPSIVQIGRGAEGKLVMEDWHTFGPDYDRTLMAWHANVTAAWSDLGPAYDDRFQRMWNFYLLVSAGSFRARANQLWQVVFSRDGIDESYRPPGIR